MIVSHHEECLGETEPGRDTGMPRGGTAPPDTGQGWPCWGTGPRPGGTGDLQGRGWESSSEWLPGVPGPTVALLCPWLREAKG